MEPPALFGDIRAANKLVEAALINLINGIIAQCENLQEQHDVSMKSLRTENEELRARLGELHKNYANSKSLVTIADLSTRLTNAEGGLMAVERAFTAFGQKWSNHDISALSGEVDQLKETTQTLLQQNNSLHTTIKHRESFIDSIVRLTAGFTSSQSPATDALHRNEGTMQLNDVVQSPDQSSATFRAPSPEEMENVESFEHITPLGVANATKRTVSQRRSESSDVSQQQTRTLSLQRKRAKSNLKKAIQVSAEDVSGIADAHTLLQQKDTPAASDTKTREEGDDAHGENVFPRSKLKSVHFPSEFSPSSINHLKKIEAGNPARETLQSIAQSPSQPRSDYPTFLSLPLLGDRKAFGAQQQTEDRARSTSALPASASTAHNLKVNAPAACSRRHSTREAKKKPIPEDLIDTRTLKID